MMRNLCKANVCFLLFALSTLLFALSSEAKVTGYCSNCHTMHNSQNGQPMAFKDDRLSPEGNPYAALLIYSCLGCHSAIDGNIWQDGVTGAPIVFNTNVPNFNTVRGLAAGNFHYVTTDDNTGHNILSSNPENTSTLGNSPPGGSFPGGYTGQLKCAGIGGCHGHNGRSGDDAAVADQTEAMKGAHHGNHTPPLGGDLTNVARNYRFLLGIKGKEDPLWEKDNANTSHHNEYKGSNSSEMDTISYFCAECHGKFHTWVGGSTEVGTASPWLRHPTDIELRSTGEYSLYTTYSMIAPVARPDPDNVADTTKVTPGADIVMCLSCHRAHASPFFKIMRWDYKGWPGSGTNGCNVCHTSKN